MATKKTSIKRKAINKKEVKNNDVQGRNIAADLDELEVPNIKGHTGIDYFYTNSKTGEIKRLTGISLPNKITWVLTAVNVAILISLVIKNV
jgi:hypothetical protein